METQAHANLSRPTSYGDDVQDLDDAVRAGLAARADPDAAPAMQRYMKSALPFRGVPKPAREELVRELVSSRPAPSPDEFGAAVRSLWDGARYREERYVALTLTGHRRWSPPQDASWVPLYRWWIVDGAWWAILLIISAPTRSRAGASARCCAPTRPR